LRIGLAVLLVLAPAFPIFSQATSVTFICNTSTNQDTLRETGVVQIRGALLAGDGQTTREGNLLPGGGNISWSASSALILENIGGDYWSGTFDLTAGDTLTYKYWADLASIDGPGTYPDGWEGPFTPSQGIERDTRLLIVGNSDTTLRVQYFHPGAGSPAKKEFTPPFAAKEDSVAIYFRVNMAGVTDANIFDPQQNGPVGVRGDNVASGSSLSWSSTLLPLTREAGSVNEGSFWSGVAYIPKKAANVGSVQYYKFFIDNPGGIDWEGMADPSDVNGNRSFVFSPGFVAGTDTTLSWVYFDNQRPFRPARPQDLQATAEDGVVHLTWLPNSDPDFLRYRIYGGTSSNSLSLVDSVDGASNTSKDFPGLPPGSQRFFRISAVDRSLNESRLSNLAPVVIGGPSTQVTLEGVLHRSGTPMSQITRVQPSVFILDESTGQEYKDATFTYNDNSGGYSLGNLPGNRTISLTISFHVTGERPTLPGNYYRYISTIDLQSLTPAQLRTYNIHIWELVHLVEPIDNTNILPGFADPGSRYNSPLRFAWEPVAGATAYQVNIRRVRDAAHPNGYGFIEQVVSILDLTEPAYLAQLADNAEHEHYEFDILAWEPGRIVGSYFTTYEAGYGGDYRFKITSEKLPPGPPRGLSGVLSAGAVTLTWMAASETDVIRYRIYGGSAPTRLAVVDSIEGITNTEIVIRDLDLDSETYYFRVTAVNSSLLESDFSNEIRFVPDTPGNNAPVVNFALADTTMSLSGPSLSYDLTSPSAVFTDPDSDILSYRARSSAPSIAAATINGTILTVNLLSAGSSQITVVAEDGRGGSDSTSFIVTVFNPSNPLEITHSRISVAPFDQPLTIRTTIENASGAVSPVLYYRRGGDNSFTSVEMREEGGEFTGLIPAFAAGSKGLEYYVVATDTNAVSRIPESGFYAARIDIPANEFTSPAITGNGAQSSYRLFSIPFDLNNKDPGSVFADFGEYERTEWRFYEVRAGGTRGEFPDISPIAPGRGYWVISKGASKSAKIGAASTITTDVAYSISLHSQWNLVGNPFDFAIPIEKIRFSDGQQVELRSFNGQWNDPVNAPVQQILPFEGYAIFNNSTSSQSLLIDANIYPVDDSPSVVRKEGDPPDWLLRISSKCASAVDRDNFLGIIQNSDAYWDSSDRPEPPTIGEYVGLYFPRPEWRTLSAQYCTDFRPAVGEGQIWEFEVVSNIEDVIQLEVDGVLAVPQYDITLHDPSLGVAQDLRQNSRYTLSATSGNRRLQLIVGSAAFMQTELRDLISVPKSFELAQNFPNPFNPSTTIKFGLPTDAIVTLDIFNVAGELINTLIAGERLSAGFHAAVWNGRDLSGQRVGSGLYLYQFRSEEYRATGKMLLVR
jgi:hypothetical protein